MDYSALHSELTTDPASLGYAALIALGDDTGLASLLNAPNAGTVTLTSVDKQTMLLGLLPAVMALAGLDTAAQAQWDRVLSLVQSVDSIDVSSPAVQAIFADAVSASLLTTDQVAAITTRQGSRAEIVLGAGTVVTFSDIAIALGN